MSGAHGLRTSAGITIALCLAASSATARAQSPLELDCRPGRVADLTAEQIGSEWERYHPRLVLGRLGPIITLGDYGEVMDSVLANARLALGAVTDTSLLRRYRVRLGALEQGFTAMLALPTQQQPRHMADVVQPSLFEPIASPARPAYRIFAGTPDEMVVTASMPRDERRALCWPAITIHRLLTLYQAPVRERTVRTLEALAARWDNYIEHGYSQFPWELVVNGRNLSGGYEPPGRQFILLHPSIGVEANGTIWKELQRVDVAVLEAVGAIFYNRDHTRYAGVSGVISLPANRNVAGGVYAHLWFPQAKLGHLWRSDPDPRRRRSVLISVDLYDFFDGIPDRIREAKASALGRAALAGVPQP